MGVLRYYVNSRDHLETKIASWTSGGQTFFAVFRVHQIVFWFDVKMFGVFDKLRCNSMPSQLPPIILGDLAFHAVESAADEIQIS